MDKDLSKRMHGSWFNMYKNYKKSNSNADYIVNRIYNEDDEYIETTIPVSLMYKKALEEISSIIPDKEHLVEMILNTSLAAKILEEYTYSGPIVEDVDKLLYKLLKLYK